MTRQELYAHERANMAIRHALGYDQHDDHVWRWLLHELDLIWTKELKRKGSH